MRNTSFAFWCITGLFWLQRCNAKAGEQHWELQHTEEPRSDPAMGSKTAKRKSERQAPWAAFSILSCSITHEMSETRGDRQHSLEPLVWKSWNIPTALASETAHPLNSNAAPHQESWRGWGHLQGQLRPAGPHSHSLGTASLGRSKGQELLLARECFRRRKGNARDTSQEGPHELSAGSSSKEHLQCSPQPGAQGCAAKMKTKTPKD